MPELAAHLAYLEAALASAAAAPLSSRKAWLAAMLVDAFADRLFIPGAAGDDILEFRSGLAAGSPALAVIFALCAMRDDGPRLVLEAVEVPLAEYGQLGVADFMVSLYNGHSVQRLRTALPDGGRRDVHEVLAEAVAALHELSGPGTDIASTG